MSRRRGTSGDVVYSGSATERVIARGGDFCEPSVAAVEVGSAEAVDSVPSIRARSGVGLSAFVSSLPLFSCAAVDINA